MPVGITVPLEPERCSACWPVDGLAMQHVRKRVLYDLYEQNSDTCWKEQPAVGA